MGGNESSAVGLVGRVAVGEVLGVVLVGVSLVGTRKILSQLCKGVCLLSYGGGWAGNGSSALCKLVGGGSCKAYKVVGVVANTILVKTRNNAFTGLPSNSVFFTIESDI